MSQLISTFQNQQGQFWQAFLEHIQISLISIFIAILISIPLALLLRRFPKIAEPILQVTGIFQTIPSLALLGLLIPFIGIGSLPALLHLLFMRFFQLFKIHIRV